MSTYVNKLIPNTNNVYLRFDPYTINNAPAELIALLSGMLSIFTVPFDTAVIEVHDYEIEVQLHKWMQVLRDGQLIAQLYERSQIFDFSAVEQPEMVKHNMAVLEEVFKQMVEHNYA